MENESVYRTLWSRFPFSEFDDRQKTLIPFWEKWALEVLHLLEEGKNVGIIADTGAGKTIIAHLVATARYNKVLFLIPERILGQQHKRLLESMAGTGSYVTQVLTGSMPHKKRFWNPDAQFTFATPQTFVADFNRWKFEMNFDFVVFDELHHGSGEYDYTKIALICKALNIPTIGLSASPGKNMPEIEKIAEIMGFDTFCRVPDPNNGEKKRFIYPKIIPMNDPLTQIEKYISGDIAQIVRKICEEKLYPSRGKEIFIPERDIEKIEKQLEQMVPSRLKYNGLFLLGAYRKIYSIMRFALVESYGTAIAYWDKKLSADTSKSGKFVRGLKETNRAISFMRTLDEKDHPKIKQLLSLVNGYTSPVRGIVFVNNRNTGQILARLLNEHGWKTEIITGGMSVKKQTDLLRKLADGTIRFIVSTSAIEEGVSVPEIGCVIQYSVPLSEKPRIQRSGRTARVNYGAVDYIILDHPIDKIPFFVSARGEKTMKEIVSHYEKYKERDGETQLFLFS